MTRLVTALSVAVALTAGSVSASSSAAGAASVPPPEPTVVTDPAMASFGVQRLDWNSCGRRLRCAGVRVPLDYAQPDGQTIRIAIARPAGPLRKRVMLFNPGGPGGTGLDIRGFLAFFSPAMLKRYTPIGFDPRGVAGSGDLVCYTNRQLQRFGKNPPRTRSGQEDLFAFAARINRSCQRRYPTWLPNLGTPDVARDLDVIRQALRQPRLHYLGVSYGTYLGATYAAAFPDNVGRMILDSGLSPLVDMRGWLRAQARATQQVFRVFARDCVSAGPAVCPWPGDTDEVIDGFTRLLRQLDRRPIQPPGFPEPVTAMALASTTQSLLAQGPTGESMLLLYLQALHPPQTQARAKSADGRALARKVRRVTQVPANLQTVNQAVNCSDRPTPNDPRTARADARRWGRFAPSFGRYFAWRPITCASWPVRNGEPVLPRPRSTTRRPVLLIGGTHDPLTPIQWTFQLARGFARSRVVTWTGVGHGALGFGSECLQRTVSRYARSGRLPHAGRVCN